MTHRYWWASIGGVVNAQADALLGGDDPQALINRYESMPEISTGHHTEFIAPSPVVSLLARLHSGLFYVCVL